MATLIEELKSAGGILNRAKLPLRFGDPDAEYDAIREGAAVGWMAWRGVLEIAGRDRIRFLHNATTNDLLKLATGRDGVSFAKGEKIDLPATPAGPGQFTVIPSRQGKMIADAKLRLLEDRVSLELDRGAISSTLATLGGMIVGEDVQVKDRSAEFDLLRVDGPKARETVSKALGPVSDLPEFHFAAIGDVLVSPSPYTGEPGYDLVAPAADSAALWKKLTEAGAKPAGFFAFETARIEHGFPRWAADMNGTLLPMEAGLEPIAISYTKGCYLGQEVIQRVKTYSEAPRALVALAIARLKNPEGGNTAVPNPGSPILADGANVGNVTSLGWSRRSESFVGLGLVRKERKAPGTKVTLDAGALKYGAEVRALPWHAKYAPAGTPP
jgi:aminomethyltransferase